MPGVLGTVQLQAYGAKGLTQVSTPFTYKATLATPKVASGSRKARPSSFAA